MSESARQSTEVLLVDGRPVEYRVTGSGDAPTTVFAHGLADTMKQLTGFGEHVEGRQVFFSFGGHGRSVAAPGPLRYGVLSSELLAVSERTGADQAVGMSMGAGTILRVLVEQPTRFRRAVLMLLPTITGRGTDEPFLWFADLAELVEKGDSQGIVDMLLRICPPMPPAESAVWRAQRAAFLIEEGYAPRLREVGALYPVQRLEDLGRIRTPVQIICHENDLAHSVTIGKELAGLLPHCELHVLPERSIFAPDGRSVAAGLIGEFLARP
ncbi:hypothetical protein CFP65_0945 [Kitasatospora sp. MMS16-BH015]|uniref:alpha/beta fold hydrolase n=1 Tax=Kitasatospora sp. MMS16-BH015 TaxID=2018025 RepID=UPI000CA36230|nr:alpha/beta hydrolase [Kitasatospora sp. MMS16-BH015]AUG75864.1 hypothetical protein CFP65_0945 [Kitasatospora sp. MMS16-BH015]